MKFHQVFHFCSLLQILLNFHHIEHIELRENPPKSAGFWRIPDYPNPRISKSGIRIIRKSADFISGKNGLSESADFCQSVDQDNPELRGFEIHYPEHL